MVGGGPAGSITSLLLSREGFDVLQLVPFPARVDRPNEILCPTTTRLLRQLGLTEPQKKADCRGVLACWKSEDLDFYDYTLTACAPALVVQRDAFHNALVTSARNAGVRVLFGARLRSSQAMWARGAIVNVTAGRSSYGVSARWVIDATGRQSALRLPPKIAREHFDRLVAFSIPFETKRCKDCLILEAVEQGWWYITPEVEDVTHLVFLTDSDTVPHGVEVRRKWIEECYQRTIHVSGFAKDDPSFECVGCTDARFSRLTSAVLDRWVAVGDRAVALDPLSGNGVSFALTAAQWLANAFRSNESRISQDYIAWCQHKVEVEELIRQEVYVRALERFPEAKFWIRRGVIN